MWDFPPQNGKDRKMKDEQMPEKDIFEDLDDRVADIEKEETAEAPVHKKEKPKPGKKRVSRPMIIGALIVCIIFVAILAFPFLKQMIAPLLPKKKEKPPAFFVTPPVPKAKPPVPPPVPKEQDAIKTIPEGVEITKPVPPVPPPVPKEQDAVKTIPEEVELTKPIPQKITKPSKPLTQEQYYTIQIGAFRDEEYARDLLEILKEHGLDGFLTRLEGKKRGTFYKVFVGNFTNEKEAVQFLEEKEILDDYPGSFVRKGPSLKFHQLLGEL